MEIIDSFTEIEEIWKRFDKPVVIKPTGLTGGSGVCIGIKTIEEAKEAYKYAKQVIDTKIRKDWQTKVMIQEQVSGRLQAFSYRWPFRVVTRESLHL